MTGGLRADPEQHRRSLPRQLGGRAAASAERAAGARRRAARAVRADLCNAPGIEQTLRHSAWQSADGLAAVLRTQGAAAAAAPALQHPARAAAAPVAEARLGPQLRNATGPAAAHQGRQAQAGGVPLPRRLRAASAAVRRRVPPTPGRDPRRGLPHRRTAPAAGGGRVGALGAASLCGLGGRRRSSLAPKPVRWSENFEHPVSLTGRED